jgi:hypothetical protein
MSWKRAGPQGCQRERPGLWRVEGRGDLGRADRDRTDRWWARPGENGKREAARRGPLKRKGIQKKDSPAGITRRVAGKPAREETDSLPVGERKRRRVVEARERARKTPWNTSP